ncbi:type IV toxin-antitoxin system AbiEi family antitoxin [Mesorhizobium sp. SB112]|uniref:type IV toxin-antitoxin system AbiEi family antitoxin n=1 Tax=Mesorhizobium sp. SB112 TaxID=3151853 RepID=UPI003263B1A0
MPKIKAGRNLIVFYYRKDIAAVETGIEDRKTDTGRMKISSPALTALDLLRYPQAADGIDNVATVLTDLGENISPPQFAALSDAAERPVLQRLGHLLERLGHAGDVVALWSRLRQIDLQISEWHGNSAYAFADRS